MSPCDLQGARLQALIGVALAYRLAPRRVADTVWYARCPRCVERGRTLAIRPTPTGGAAYGCALCGTHGSRPGTLARLVESQTVLAAALARLDAVVARHGAARLSAALGESDDPTARAVVAELPGDGLRIVAAANDDVCRCPTCEGIDGRGEGDA